MLGISYEINGHLELSTYARGAALWSVLSG